MLTACYYVDDPGTPIDNNLYLANSKPTCTFGQSICLEIIFNNNHDLILLNLDLNSPTQSTINETTYYTNVQYTSSLLQSMLSSTIQSTMSESHLISEEIFTTVSIIIPSSSSQILPSSVAPAADISKFRYIKFGLLRYVNLTPGRPAPSCSLENLSEDYNNACACRFFN